MPEKKEIAYCTKCREKQEMKEPKQIAMRNGKPALKGTCTVCGTGMFRILPSKKQQEGK